LELAALSGASPQGRLTKPPAPSSNRPSTSDADHQTPPHAALTGRVRILDELMDIKFKVETIGARGRHAILTAALIAWNIEETDEEDAAIVEWEFTEPARQVLGRRAERDSQGS
jgi:hypothetical protein